MTDSNEPGREAKSVDSAMVRGAAWMVSMRWSIRAIGLVNTVILARLLTPEDFGIVAMAMIVVGLLTELAETNVEIALIRNRNADRADYDSAWTMKILTGALITGGLFAAAPFAAGYFGDDWVEIVIQIVALRALILGFENIGVVDFRRNLQFGLDFRYGVFRRLSLFVIALGIAFALRDYRALAIAAPLSAVLTVGLSYYMSSYRPRFCVSRLRGLWSFSQWLMVDHACRFISERVDQFVIGGLAGASRLGHYYMASEVSAMPTREVIVPAGRALIPTFAKLAHDAAASRRAFVNVVGIQALYAFPAGFGMSVVAADLVPILLGAQWVGAVPFFQWLGIHAAFEAFILGLRPYFMARDGERAFALTSLCHMLLLVPSIALAGHLQGIEAVAITRTGVTAGFVLIVIMVATRMGFANLSAFFAILWRPLSAAVTMWFAVRYLHDSDIEFAVLSLLRDVAIGGGVFAGALLGLWFVSGRPEGAERATIDFVARRLKRSSP